MAKPIGHYDSTNVFTLLVKLITESDSNSKKCSVFNNRHINYICDGQCLMVSWFGEPKRLDVPFCFFLKPFILRPYPSPAPQVQSMLALLCACQGRHLRLQDPPKLSDESKQMLSQNVCVCGWIRTETTSQVILFCTRWTTCKRQGHGHYHFYAGTPAL